MPLVQPQALSLYPLAGNLDDISPAGNNLTAHGGTPSFVPLFYGLNVAGPASLDGGAITTDGSGHFTAASYIVSGGASNEFLKGDGSLDGTAYAPLASPTFTGTATVANLVDSGLTASTVLVANGSKELTSSSVSSTTLGYLDATSSVQTQLNALAPKASPTFTGTATVATPGR